METNKEQVVALLKEKGYPAAAIAGIVGNIDVETGGTFNYQQKQKGGAGYGLFQFDFLKDYYNNWLKNNNLKDSAQSQVDFFHDTVYGDSKDIIGRGTALQVQAALQQDDPELIATDVSDLWLRPGKPHIQRRQKSALSAFTNLGTSQPAPTDGVDITAPIPMPDLTNKEDIKRAQKALGVKVDGYWGDKSKKAWKETNELFAPEPDNANPYQMPSPNEQRMKFAQQDPRRVDLAQQMAKAPQAPQETQYASMEDLLMDRDLLGRSLLG